MPSCGWPRRRHLLKRKARRYSLPTVGDKMQNDIGRLILRLAVGGLLLLHGEHKLMNGIATIRELVVHKGLPEALAYGVYLGEVVGPILILLGLFARVGAGLVIAD